jgi:hypothetical protein
VGPHAAKKKFLPERWLAEKKKPQKPTMTTVDPESAAQYGLTVNQNNGYH